MRIRSLKHKQLIALLLIALTPLFALTASMWMQAQNSKEQAVQTYQGYADTIAIALEKELDRQKERLEEVAVAAGLLFSSPDNADIRAFEQILYITSGRYSSSIAVNVSGQLLAILLRLRRIRPKASSRILPNIGFSGKRSGAAGQL